MIKEELVQLEKITDALTKNGYLVDQTKQWEYAFNAVPDAVFIINVDHKIKFANAKLIELLNIPKDEILNQYCYILLNCNNAVCSYQCVESPELRKEKCQFGQYFIERLNGWFDFTRAPIFSETGKLLGFICILRDITEARVTKAALEKSEKDYRELVELMGAAVYEIDFKNARFTYVNRTMAEKSGYSCEELLTMTITDILTEESKKIWLTRLEAYHKGETLDPVVEYDVRLKNGNIIHVLCNVQYKIEDGVAGARVVAIDITEKAKVDLRIRNMLRTCSFAVQMFNYEDNEFIFTYANPASEETMGIAEADIIGKNLVDVFPAVRDSDLLEKYRHVMETGEPLDFILKYKDDRFDGLYDLHAFKISDDSMTLMFREVTEEIKLKDQVKELTNKLQDAETECRMLANYLVDKVEDE